MGILHVLFLELSPIHPSRHHLKAQLDPQNAGVLIVMIEGASGQRGIGADEISRRLERDDEGCTIM